MVLERRQPRVLVEVRDTINLMAVTRADDINNTAMVWHLCVLRSRPQDIEVNSGVIHESRPFLEFALVIQAIDLSTLSIGPVRLLLDLLGHLVVALSVVSLGHGEG